MFSVAEASVISVFSVAEASAISVFSVAEASAISVFSVAEASVIRVLRGQVLVACVALLPSDDDRGDVVGRAAGNRVVHDATGDLGDGAAAAEQLGEGRVGHRAVHPVTAEQEDIANTEAARRHARLQLRPQAHDLREHMSHRVLPDFASTF